MPSIPSRQLSINMWDRVQYVRRLQRYLGCRRKLVGEWRGIIRRMGRRSGRNMVGKHDRFVETGEGGQDWILRRIRKEGVAAAVGGEMTIDTRQWKAAECW